MSFLKDRSIWLGSCGGWHLPQTAKALAAREALAGLWITNKNSSNISSELYRRCWPYHLAIKPLLHLAPQILQEKAFYACFPVWRNWLKKQNWPSIQVVQAITGYSTEPFDQADRIGALKVVDCANSHPVTYFGNWQRECDLWCPGENVPIPRWMFARMTRELQRADVVLCPSIFVRDSMIQNGISPDQCFINPFGVDVSIFKQRSLNPLRPRFIAVGTICVRKGFQYLFQAYAKVKKVLPDAELVVVGDYKSDFKCQRPKWEGSFIHVRSATHEELAKLLTNCTAFVFPSLEEGFARVIPEAMACGLPIIATHESGATTLVQDGIEGFIVQGQNTDQIASAMIRLAEDRELNRAMGEASFRKGTERNTWQDYADRLINEYERRYSLI